jgi:hypothetical protein
MQNKKKKLKKTKTKTKNKVKPIGMHRKKLEETVTVLKKQDTIILEQ